MALLFNGCIKSIQVVVFSSDNIGITSSTCRHCTLSNSFMCSDFIPHPSFLFIIIIIIIIIGFTTLK